MHLFLLTIGIALQSCHFAHGFVSPSNGFVVMGRTKSSDVTFSGHNVYLESSRSDGERRHCDRGSKDSLRSPLFSRNSNNGDSQPEDEDVGEKSLNLIAFQPAATQQLAVLAFFVALALGTCGCVELWFGPGQALLGTDFFLTICQRIFPVVFGLIFAIVGVGHFVFVKNFARIVPPKGTWGGLWQLPAPFSEQLGIEYAEYQSYLSGIFEFLSGIWLLAGGLGYTDPALPGFLMFLLTIAVTPANLYMLTHDASPGGGVPKLTTTGHVLRFFLQCGLLSNFWIMSHPPSV